MYMPASNTSARLTSLNDAHCCFAVDVQRLHFMHKEDLHAGEHRAIKRSSVYGDIFDVYTDASSDVRCEFPLNFKFEGEKAYDAGGVCREVFLAFGRQFTQNTLMESGF